MDHVMRQIQPIGHEIQRKIIIMEDKNPDKYMIYLVELSVSMYMIVIFLGIFLVEFLVSD